ncbi:MAG: Stp1/IreP family PP2C-type Ser/Thr phosphatase [Lachnospiraceae bacterium]|nr:Stp1/IreP family PP2C-type Ser/Thr phosphatase [Lachnospiraceae bacterium]
MEAIAITDVGVHREINQDYVYCNNNPIGLLPNLYIVADGMGGHRAGDFASHLSVDVFAAEIQEQKARTIIGSMECAVHQANDRLRKEAASSQDYEGMGTTLVAASLTEDKIFITNVGDSRLYLLSKSGHMRQITQDHSLVEEMILKGELDRKDAKHHPKKNVITRALGAAEHLVPDFFEVELLGEEYVLMCSDGLNNMVEDIAIKEVLLLPELNLEEKAKRLIELANENGGKDNISVVLIHR